jgi:hypothetical protein
MSSRSAHILYLKVKLVWNHIVELVKVHSTYYSPKDATSEHEDDMQTQYLHLLEEF